jgi:hypothetical protein
MPMITVTLPCGCKPVLHYPTRVPWGELPERERGAIVRHAASGHACPKSKAATPVMSDQPQKP